MQSDHITPFVTSHFLTQTVTSEGCALPHSACHQLERSGRDLLSGSGDTDDDTFTPSFMACLQSSSLKQQHAHFWKLIYMRLLLNSLNTPCLCTGSTTYIWQSTWMMNEQILTVFSMLFTSISVRWFDHKVSPWFAHFRCTRKNSPHLRQSSPPEPPGWACCGLWGSQTQWLQTPWPSQTLQGWGLYRLSWLPQQPCSP